MISVVLIFTGILWVLFTQMDNNFEYTINSPDIYKKQSKLIQEIYQIAPDAAKTQPEMSSVTLENLQEIREAKTANSQLQARSNPITEPKGQYNEVWSTFPPARVTNSVPDDFLRHNPWNPDYQPGM